MIAAEFNRIGVMGVYELPLEMIGLGRRGDHEDRMPRILAMVATLEAGRPLPPVIVHETPSGYFYCDDGYHRLHAYTLAGRRFAVALVTTMLDPLAGYDHLARDPDVMLAMEPALAVARNVS